MRCSSLESCRLVPKVNGKQLKPEDFDLVKDSKSGGAVYAKIYSRKFGRLNAEYLQDRPITQST